MIIGIRCVIIKLKRSILKVGVSLLIKKKTDSQWHDTSDLAKLVHDFRCKRAEDMKIKELADKTRYFKETPEGVNIMCKAIEEMRNEAAMLERIQMVMNLLSLGTVSKSDIAKASGFTLEEIDEIEKQMSSVTT